MKLCYASFEKILRYCRFSRANIKSHDISRKILMSVDREYFDEIPGSTGESLQQHISHLRDCTDEIKSNFVNKAISSAPQVVSDFFKNNIVPLLDDKKYKIIILAIRDIISKDSSIKETTIVDKVSRKTKNDIIKQTIFSFTDFIAGVFLFITAEIKNISIEGDETLPMITNDYFSMFESATEKIELTESGIPMDGSTSKKNELHPYQETVPKILVSDDEDYKKQYDEFYKIHESMQIEVFDENGVATGKAKTRSEIHKDGDWHRISLVCIADENRHILLQQRSSDYDKFPKFWDLSVASHIRFGDNSMITARREILCEIGIPVKDETLLKDFQYITCFRNMFEYDDVIEKQYYDLFLVRTKNIPIQELNFNKYQVRDVKWVTLAELTSFNNKGLFFPRTEWIEAVKNELVRT